MKIEELIQNIDTNLYPNRWIAVVRGRVIGVGTTPGQAQRAAKQTRPKDTPLILFVDAQGNVKERAVNSKKLAFETDWAMKYSPLPEVINILQKQRIEAYLVGGPVRDLLLGRENIVDLDFVVPVDGIDVARRVADALGAAFYPLDPARDVGRVIMDLSPGNPMEKMHLDFAACRQETLLADLGDRDFTINAMALSLKKPPQLIDPFHGQDDLERGQIRTVSPTAFQHDPLRVLRAVRLAGEFGFSVERDTQAQLRQAVSGLSTISPERQRDELLKLLNTPAPGQTVQMLHRFGVLPHLLPEIEATVGVTQGLPYHLDVFDHTTTALEAWATMIEEGFPDISARQRGAVKQYLNQQLSGELTLQQLIPLALLWHDAGKPLTRTEETAPGIKIRFLGHERESARIARQAMTSFRFSNQAVEFLDRVISHHMRPLLLAQEGGKISRRAIYRFFRDTGGPSFQAGVAVALHALADHEATYLPGSAISQIEERPVVEVVNTLITSYFEQHARVVFPPPLLTGRDLIDTFGLTQGQLIGLLLDRLQEAQASGQVINKTQALAFIQNDPDFIKNRSKSGIDA